MSGRSLRLQIREPFPSLVEVGNQCREVKLPMFLQPLLAPLKIFTVEAYQFVLCLKGQGRKKSFLLSAPFRVLIINGS